MPISPPKDPNWRRTIGKSWATSWGPFVYYSTKRKRTSKVRTSRCRNWSACNWKLPKGLSIQYPKHRKYLPNHHEHQDLPAKRGEGCQPCLQLHHDHVHYGICTGVGLTDFHCVCRAGQDHTGHRLRSRGLYRFGDDLLLQATIEIQNSRSNLTQLMIIITNWFAELMNLNTYISTRGDKIELDEMMKVGKTLNNSTREMIELIEKYGEIRK